MGRSRPLLADVVRNSLRHAIVSGEYPLGTKLPNEDQLSDRFAVSRVTIREAVRGLIEDGYVVRRQGSGTYVTRRPILQNSLDTNFSYTDYIESVGTRAGKQVLGARSITADAETASALGLAVGASVVELRRIRTADRRPAIYSVDVLSADIVDPVRDREVFKGSMYRYLASVDHPIDHAVAVLTPTVADRELARLLDVVPGTPLQHLKQVDYDGAGRPVMLSLEWHVPAVIELTVYRRGPGSYEGEAGSAG
jgi:DNA-binding GntR family transcriptional regulator